MIALGPADRAAAERFLMADLAGAMFPLANLAGRGRAMRSWILRDDGGGIAAFLGLSEGGMLLPRAAEGAVDWAGARAVLAEAEVAGAFGRPATVATLLAALGLDAAPCRTGEPETGFTLDLAELRLPSSEGVELRPVTPADRALVTVWRRDYEIEALGADPEEARANAPVEVGRWLAAGSHRLLWRAGAPVALTGFNADLGTVVQVGGVWCPPPLRGRGLARRAVGLHLAEARARGARRAVLSTASPAAERAYRALGFRPEGQVALRYFSAPQRVRPCP